MKLVIAAIALLVAGCGGLQPKVISSSPRTVVIQAVRGGMEKAQPLADLECKKHGRLARWVGGDDVEFFFDCVQ